MPPFALHRPRWPFGTREDVMQVMTVRPVTAVMEVMQVTEVTSGMGAVDAQHDVRVALG